MLLHINYADIGELQLSQQHYLVEKTLELRQTFNFYKLCCSQLSLPQVLGFQMQSFEEKV